MSRSDEAILANYLADGKLEVVPRKRSRKLIVLRWLVQRFEPGRRYTESEVNQIIAEVHPDFATLRRELYDAYLLDREDGVYWRHDDSVARP